MPTPAADARTRGAARRSGSDAPGELISAAERLFAARGVDSVSLREITREAAQRNSTALQYYFADRDGLLRALIDKHIEPIALRRSAMIELVAGREDLTLREGAAILVQPLISKLTSADGGPEFLQVAAELLHRADHLVGPDDRVAPILYDSLSTLDRWGERIESLMPEGSTGAPLHRRFAVIRFTHIEVGRRARIGGRIDVPLFAAQLTDMVAGLLGAELGVETKRLLSGRKSARKTPRKK